jgi:2-phosphosulfolactate phosphatase
MSSTAARSYHTQAAYDLRFEWGLTGLSALLPGSTAVVIVDVLSFTTCVEVAATRDAIVFPYRGRGEDAAAFAHERNAILASTRRDAGFSLSPASLRAIPTGTRLVLPSPNGATLSLQTGATATFAACLRNASAVARAASQLGPRVAVIAAGERWPDGSLRPGLEDLLGAGAVLQSLPGSRSPEAASAEAVVLRFQDDLLACLRQCISGRELIERFDAADDVEIAAQLDVSRTVPVLRNGAFVSQETAA